MREPKTTAGTTEPYTSQAPSPAARYCKYCGNHLSPDAKFCSKCGKEQT